MKKLRVFITIVLTAVITLTFAACSPKSAFDFDKDAAIKRAKEVIDVVNTQDYDAIYNLFSDRTKEVTSADGIKAALQSILDATGPFVEYKSADATGVISQDESKYINVYVKTKYEKVTHIYKVTFDTDLNLEGFHLES